MLGAWDVKMLNLVRKMLEGDAELIYFCDCDYFYE